METAKEQTFHPEEHRIGTLIVSWLFCGLPNSEFFDSLYDIPGGFEEAQRQIGEAVNRYKRSLLAESRSRLTPFGQQPETTRAKER